MLLSETNSSVFLIDEEETLFLSSENLNILFIFTIFSLHFFSLFILLYFLCLELNSLVSDTFGLKWSDKLFSKVYSVYFFSCILLSYRGQGKSVMTSFSPPLNLIVLRRLNILYLLIAIPKSWHFLLIMLDLLQISSLAVGLCLGFWWRQILMKSASSSEYWSGIFSYFPFFIFLYRLSISLASKGGCSVHI